MASTCLRNRIVNSPNMHQRAGAAHTAMVWTRTDVQPSLSTFASSSTLTVHCCCVMKPPAIITTSSYGSTWPQERLIDSQLTSLVLPSKRIWGTERNQPRSDLRTMCHREWGGRQPSGRLRSPMPGIGGSGETKREPGMDSIPINHSV